MALAKKILTRGSICDCVVSEVLQANPGQPRRPHAGRAKPQRREKCVGSLNPTLLSKG